MKIPRLYTGPDGQSHWDDDFEVELAPGEGDWVSALQGAPGVSFRRAPRDHVIDWHPAPRRQYVVTLDGEVEYEIGDGTRRRFGPGSIFLADDLTGQGHVARGVGAVDRVSLYVPLTAADSRERAQRLVSALREIGPEIEAAARQAELERKLPDTVVQRLRDLGVFWLKTPESLGGTELDPLDFCDVLEEVAYHDASAGWAVMVGNGTTGFLAGSLPDEGIDEVFTPGEPLPIIAGQFIPRGKAVTVDGGLRVTGRWSFSSGLPHAAWLAGGCTVGDGDIRIVCVPKAQATVHDTWHVAGLQGTGSHDFSLDDAFVPDRRTMRLIGEPAKRGGDLHRQPAQLFVNNELGPVAVGIARRALDDMRALATGMSRGFAGTQLRDRAAFHKAIGLADARLEAASLLYRDTVALCWRRFLEGTADEALIAIAMARATYAVDTCVDLVSDVFRYGGGRVLALDNPMQRHLRNLIAVAQHVFLSDENLELAGKALLERD